jgi:uncharacterized protein YjiS (DUF1127 family)
MLGISAAYCFVCGRARTFAGMRFLLLCLGRLVREAVLYVGASPQSRRHQLETLSNLDDHLLRDIGLDRSVAANRRADHGTSSTGA